MAQPTQPTNTSANATTNATADTQTTKTDTKGNTSAKKVLPPHFEMSIEGAAYINGAVKDYEVVVKVPDLGEGKGDGHYMTFILSEDRGEILAKAIRKKYGDCETIRTYYLIDRVYKGADGEEVKRPHGAKDLTENISVQNMRKNELLAYIKEMRYSIDIELYKKVDDLRDAVKMYETDKEAFLEKQEKDIEEARLKEEADLLNQ